MSKRYSHVGFFAFCPVLVGQPFSQSPLVAPRWFWCIPLMHLAIAVQIASIYVCSMMDPDWKPVWRIKITGLIR